MKSFKQYRWFAALFFFLLTAVCLLEHTKIRTPKEHFPVMLDAACRTEKAIEAIKKERLIRNLPLNPFDDPNETGIIGESYTEITTTLGSLESKRSAANPNTAAMVVDMLTRCGISEGDPVAVNLSSSFPGLNTAVLCALDAMKLNGIIINSVGASTYGANLPDFTWLDMEHLLLEQGMITNHSRWFSLGGSDDIGKEMPEEITSAIIKRISGYGLEFLYYENLSENLAARKTIYRNEVNAVSEISKNLPACFINVGGNLLSFGEGDDMVSSQNGILLPQKNSAGTQNKKTASGGLIQYYLSENVPVIHLLNLKTLLPAYGLPYDPSPVPAAGNGLIYTEWHYNRGLALFFLAGALIILKKAVHSRPHRKMPL